MVRESEKTKKHNLFCAESPGQKAFPVLVETDVPCSQHIRMHATIFPFVDYIFPKKLTHLAAVDWFPSNWRQISMPIVKGAGGREVRRRRTNLV